METLPMSRLPLLFMAAAATCLAFGVAMGLYMGIVHDFSLAPVHAHTNLVGWTSLSLMGLTFRAWPALAQGRLAVAQLVISVSAAFAFPPGIFLAITQDAPGLAIGAGLLWFAGVLLFLGRVLALAFGGAQQPARFAVAAAD
jgi:hypothetical protein